MNITVNVEVPEGKYCEWCRFFDDDYCKLFEIMVEAKWVDKYYKHLKCPTCLKLSGEGKG